MYNNTITEEMTIAFFGKELKAISIQNHPPKHIAVPRKPNEHITVLQHGVQKCDKQNFRNFFLQPT